MEATFFCIARSLVVEPLLPNNQDDSVDLYYIWHISMLPIESMNVLISLFRPAALNSTQQAGRVCILTAVVMIVFLHNPFSGYFAADGPLITTTRDVCGMELAEAARRASQAADKSAQESKAAMAEVMRLREKCLVTETKPANDLPFLQWSSNSPIVDWFGELGHLISALIATIAIGAIWVSAYAKGSDREL